MKINGKTHVSKVKELFRDILGVEVELLNPSGDEAADNVSFSSIKRTDHKNNGTVWKIPHGKMHIDKVATQFEDHYGVSVVFMDTNCEPADTNESLSKLQRRYARTRGELPPLAQWLDETLRSKKLTIEEVASKADVALFTLRNILLGKTLNPQIATLKKLEDALEAKIPQEITEEVEEDAAIEGLGELEDFNPWEDSELPMEAGVYVLYDVSERPVYVGKSENSIKSRILDHRKRKWFIEPFVKTGAFIHIKDKSLIAPTEKLLIRFLRSNAIVNVQYVERNGVAEPEAA